MIRLRQINVNVLEDSKEKLIEKCSKKLRINSKEIKDIEIVKKSIDARKKPDLFYSYEVNIVVNAEEKIISKLISNDIFIVNEKKYEFKITGEKKLFKRPIIVGSGPAGLYCAYMLAQNGYKPIIIERGKDVDSRILDVKKFWETGVLDKNSNVQFGEGGAGTFSDGKLNTLVKDNNNRQKKVLEIFVESGAPSEILYENKPHIGTDILTSVVKNIRKKIISMGGEFRFDTCLTNINFENGFVKSIIVNNSEEIETDVLVLAIGHSARDTFKMLYDLKLNMKSKPFAVGIRIEHPQKLINKSQYGVEKHAILPNASYKLTHKALNGRGVYTFCMCPGGYVVNSSSEENMLAINGMSNYKRDTENANSAVIVTISPNDFGDNVMSGVEFQRNLEKKTYSLCNGKIPVQLYGDFKANQISTKFGTIKPIFKGNYEFGNIRTIFPNYINDALIDGIEAFSKKIKNFNCDDAIIAGVESRTSSPIRIQRDEFGESNIKGIYPIGEGAGYAGGITSAAIDGIIAAENIAKVYKVN